MAMGDLYAWVHLKALGLLGPRFKNCIRVGSALKGWVFQFKMQFSINPKSSLTGPPYNKRCAGAEPLPTDMELWIFSRSIIGSQERHHGPCRLSLAAGGARSPGGQGTYTTSILKMGFFPSLGH